MAPFLFVDNKENMYNSAILCVYHPQRAAPWGLWEGVACMLRGLEFYGVHTFIKSRQLMSGASAKAKPQMKAPRVAPLEGAFTYGFAIRVTQRRFNVQGLYRRRLAACGAAPVEALGVEGAGVW
jgi:hypothetical protein